MSNEIRKGKSNMEKSFSEILGMQYLQIWNYLSFCTIILLCIVV